MKTSRALSPLAAVAGFAVNRPRLIVAIAIAIIALTALSLSRMRISTSLEAMFGTHSDSARAFHLVMNEFRAVDALLVLIEPAPDSDATPEDAARLADLLVNALWTDPRTRDGIAWAGSRRDAAFAHFFAERIAPSAPFYLGESAAREIIDRFQPERLARQFARNEALIASPGPAGAALSNAILRDPLRHFELAARSGLGRIEITGASAADEQPHETSTDARATLVRIASNASINDMDQARLLVRNVTAIATELRDRTDLKDIFVRLAGPYAIATASSETIRADAIFVTILSVAINYFLFVFFTRRWIAPLAIGATAAVGLGAGFALCAMVQPAVSPVATVVAALLAGLGVDYGLHFVSHFDDLRTRGAEVSDAVTETARELAMPITTNCFTSIFGFIALWPSQIQMLSDFARLGAAGLLGAWLAVFTLLPALLVLTNRGRRRGAPTPPRFGALADFADRTPRVLASTALILFGIAVIIVVAHPAGTDVEGDLTVLHPQPNAALAATDDVLLRFAGQGEVVPILIEVPSAELLVPTAIDVARALDSEPCRAAGVEEVYGVHRLLSDPRTTEAVRGILGAAEAESLLAHFDAALESSAFEPSAYNAYRALLREMLTTTVPPSLESLGAYPSIARRLLPADSLEIGAAPTRTVLIVRLREPLRDRDQRSVVITTLKNAVEPFPGATIAALAAVTSELEDAARRDLPRSAAISLILVLGWLALMFRRTADAALSLVPLGFAGVFAIAFMTVVGVRFNPINIIALPLLFGIAVDAGVFLVACARRAREDGAIRAELASRLRPAMHASLLAAATTIAGFLSLCATHTPAIRSLGMLASIGIMASFFGAATLLAPLLLIRANRRRS